MKGILFVGFGNHSELTPEALERFPGYQITSARTVKEGLAACRARTLLVQPVFLLPGFEYERLCRESKAYHGELCVGKPLLSSAETVRKLADILLEEYNQKAVLFVGHGSEHAAGGTYAELRDVLRAQSGQTAFVGVLSGEPDFDAVVRSILQNGVGRIFLVPLMMSAGAHVKNEIFGRSAASWQRRLAAAGLEVRCVQRGLCEYPAVRRMIFDSAAQTIGSNFP